MRRGWLQEEHFPSPQDSRVHLPNAQTQSQLIKPHYTVHSEPWSRKTAEQYAPRAETGPGANRDNKGEFLRSDTILRKAPVLLPQARKAIHLIWSRNKTVEVNLGRCEIWPNMTDLMFLSPEGKRGPERYLGQKLTEADSVKAVPVRFIDG